MSLPPPPVRPLTNDAVLYDWLYALYSHVIGVGPGISSGSDGILSSLSGLRPRSEIMDAMMVSPRVIREQDDNQWLMALRRPYPREMSIRVVSADASIATGEFADVDASSAAVMITLPPASTNSGKMIGVAKADSSGNAVTLSGQVNGSATTDLTTQYTALLLISNGTEWRAW